MPRPKTKPELQKQSQENFKKLNDYVAAFSSEEQQAEFPGGTMNRNIRDVLAHLHHWHLMFLDWYEVGTKGEKPAIPAPGYTWKTTPELNRKIWEKYRKMVLSEVQQKLKQSHAKVEKVIEQHSGKELFEKKRYKWTGSTSLGAYLISATASHYDWAYKLIKKCKK
ncbi:ClbS/DfsB family four-helix bundle protein [Tunicatimonas pelagia]|uniref:ClbS/DfsB family four-helix bundle protein n=1 Tax=Tunicatimonas pelagia TaxID=931531 RepID=UPI00266685C2|nr:ClbS/DfsB family four-helix bundle protein [Tunicatimonas pelagia]WKN41375.1 ClbS/DfsB family four-helix bundle protein [Tunicatimonas pelagia]